MQEQTWEYDIEAANQSGAGKFCDMLNRRAKNGWEYVGQQYLPNALDAGGNPITHWAVFRRPVSS